MSVISKELSDGARMHPVMPSSSGLCIRLHSQCHQPNPVYVNALCSLPVNLDIGWWLYHQCHMPGKQESSAELSQSCAPMAYIYFLGLLAPRLAQP